MNGRGPANRLAHPRFGVEKLYRVVVAGTPDSVLTKLTDGVWLAEGMYAKRVRVAGTRGQATILEMTRPKAERRGAANARQLPATRLMSLTRVAVGLITLKGLGPGEWRSLTAVEVGLLGQGCRGDRSGPDPGLRSTAASTSRRRSRPAPCALSGPRPAEAAPPSRVPRDRHLADRAVPPRDRHLVDPATLPRDRHLVARAMLPRDPGLVARAVLPPDLRRGPRHASEGPASRGPRHASEGPSSRGPHRAPVPPATSGSRSRAPCSVGPAAFAAARGASAASAPIRTGWAKVADHRPRFRSRRRGIGPAPGARGQAPARTLAPARPRRPRPAKGEDD